MDDQISTFESTQIFGIHIKTYFIIWPSQDAKLFSHQLFYADLWKWIKNPDIDLFMNCHIFCEIAAPTPLINKKWTLNSYIGQPLTTFSCKLTCYFSLIILLQAKVIKPLTHNKLLKVYKTNKTILRRIKRTIFKETQHGDWCCISIS